MKILAILGSPRKGNSEILLEEAIKLCNGKKHELTIIKPCELNISGCTACDGCRDTGQCILRDDMDKVYPLLREAQRIIIASPIFFFGVPAQLKLLIDRCQSLWYEKYILKKIFQQPIKKKALLMLVGGMKKGEIGITCAEATLKAFLRTIDVREHKTLSYLGYDEPGAILKDLVALEKVKYATKELLKND
ncbi:flavodoxin family protein [Thermodesulfovibrio yellowstonii]|uniref:flavodoxin family protein n=1 Tax=Thermodesulfovibrio yellowstonii TaxID=28262 RepID=UPI0024B387C8|nr:flavodoxin family protein [Thermodesulfovibrio yellowstonii]MDI6865245.1 flavodoxin family protein [Thermodesulfovibrio yellowstonii]